MNKKKAFVVFLVEGKSDIAALEDSFKDLFDEVDEDNINVEFRVGKEPGMDGKFIGDITCYISDAHMGDRPITPSNIEDRIYEYYFQSQDHSSGLNWNDVTHIVHILDTDGAYTNSINYFTGDEEELVKKLDMRAGKDTLYFDDHIAVKENLENIEDRNKRKKDNLEKLTTIDEICVNGQEVPYEIYYFSANLDHFLYGDANLSGKDKVRKASEFAREHIGGEELAEFFESSEFSSKGDYYSSWKNVKKGKNSLKRGTNVNLLIKKIQESELDDWL